MSLLRNCIIGTVIALPLSIGSAFAGAKPDDVGRLDADLTPVGAERAGRMVVLAMYVIGNGARWMKNKE